MTDDAAAISCLSRIGYYRLSAYWYSFRKTSVMHDPLTKKIKASGKTGHTEWLEKYQQILKRSKEDFYQHYCRKYGMPLPIWVSVELWDFGMLSNFFQGMTAADKTAIAAKCGVSDF